MKKFQAFVFLYALRYMYNTNWCAAFVSSFEEDFFVASLPSYVNEQL